MILVPTIYASGLTLSAAIYTYLAGKVKPVWFYAAIFAVTFGCVCFIENSALLAAEPETLRSAYYEVPETKPFETQIGIERGYENKVAYHKRKAAEAFCEAEDMCVFLPDDKRDIAYALFQACVEASATTWLGGWGALVADLVVQMTRYGVFCCKQADMIRERLMDAEYHYNMAIYYYNKD